MMIQGGEREPWAEDLRPLKTISQRGPGLTEGAEATEDAKFSFPETRLCLGVTLSLQLPTASWAQVCFLFRGAGVLSGP